MRLPHFIPDDLPTPLVFLVYFGWCLLLLLLLFPIHSAMGFFGEKTRVLLSYMCCFFRMFSLFSLSARAISCFFSFFSVRIFFSCAPKQVIYLTSKLNLCRLCESRRGRFASQMYVRILNLDKIYHLINSSKQLALWHSQTTSLNIFKRAYVS